MGDGETKEGSGVDARLRVGASHGADTAVDDQEGYARDIKPEGAGPDEPEGMRTRDAGLSPGNSTIHPSRDLAQRARGFGIGGGYERPYRKERAKRGESSHQLYGPLPHSGYYGAGTGMRPFKLGQASFEEEMGWYRKQYGEKTSGYEPKK
jgi:hypothetical protein